MVVGSRGLHLVTGGAGFIGSNLVQALVERGDRVRVLDDLSTGRTENLAQFSSEQVQFMNGDVRDAATVLEAMRDVKAAFHQAAIPSVARSVKDPRATHMANVTGTLNVLMAARDEHVERVVFASSSSVYGNAERMPVSEDLPTHPLSPYGVSKLAGEAYASAFHHSFGLATVSLRYFNVFGPNQNPTAEYAAVVPRFISATMDDEPATIYGDGEQARDFTFVGDVVAANLLAAEAGEKALGKVINVAYNGRHSVNDLLQTIQGLVPGDHLEPQREPPRVGEIRTSQADISKAEEVLGYRPKFSFEEGLRMTVEWFAERAGPWAQRA
ncbi:MAG: SDR family oxidoreductase [Actinomycetota bacterium]